jgi:hypothetical protein
VGLLNVVAAISGGPSVQLPGGSGSLIPSSQTTLVPSSILTVASLAVEVLALFAFIAIIGLVVIIVVANRADPDPTGRRPQSVYYFAVSFVTLVTSILGSVVVVFSLVALIGHGSSSVGNGTARACVLGGLVTIVSFILLWTHVRRGVSLVGTESTSPTRRVAQSYVAAVSFLSMLVLLVVTILVAYLIFALAGPGVFGSFGGHSSAWRALLDALYVGGVAGLVLLTHRNLVAPGLRFLRPISSTASQATPASTEI